MKRTLIRNAWVLTMDENWTEWKDGYVLTEGKHILQAGQGECSESADEVIDAEGGILLPGLVNTHCHVSMIPFRSMGDDCADRLRRFLFPLENEAMTRELVYWGALYGIGEMLLSGITTFLDMYYYEETVAQAVEDAGIRGYLGETVISQPTCDSPTPAGGLLLCEQMLKRWGGEGRVRPIVAPHGTTTCTQEALARAGALAREAGTLLTLHAAEMDYEMRSFAERGMTPIGYLHAIGLTNEHLLAAHCIHLTEEDIALLAQSGARVSHCIGSNAKAGKGIAPVRDLVQAGIPVGLGTDGPSSGNTLSLFDQMRLFAACQKTRYHDRSLFPAREIVRLATSGGANALGAQSEFGCIAPGMKADLALVSLQAAHMFPVFNPYSALVYQANASDVRLTMAEGEVLVKDGRLTRMNLQEIRKELARRMGSFVSAAGRYADCI